MSSSKTFSIPAGITKAIVYAHSSRYWSDHNVSVSLSGTNISNWDYSINTTTEKKAVITLSGDGSNIICSISSKGGSNAVGDGFAFAVMY